jgi:AhpD family alkylhydroperoxidase
MPMARLPFVDLTTSGVDADLVGAVQARRGGSLLNLDRLLLHSAPLTRGWNACFGAIRTGGVLDGGLRELVILLVAVLNRAPYEFDAHAPIALAAGAPQTAVDATRVVPLPADAPLSPAEAVALRLTDAMTRDIDVPDALFAEVRTYFDAQGQIDLIATIAAYNMVSRFLVALHIGH